MMPDGAAQFGLDAPIPAHLPGHKVPGISTELRRFPAMYLTPAVRRFITWHRRHASGLPLRDDGLFHWPATLVQVIELLDAHTAMRKLNPHPPTWAQGGRQ